MLTGVRGVQAWWANAAMWVVPVLVAGIPVWGLARGVNVYQAFVDGAAQAWPLTRQLLPYMVAIFTAVGLFRGTGAMDAFVRVVGPFLGHLGVPPQVAPMALVRPLSGSASLAMAVDLMKHLGPDAPAARTAAVLQGAADTIFT